MTSLSNGLSSVDLSDRDSSPDADLVAFSEAVETFDQDTKLALLRDVFPSLTDYTISHTLKKYNGNYRQTLDDLLNQVFLLEKVDGDGDDKVHVKGIEAFSEDNVLRRGRKGKKKGKNFRGLDESNPLAATLLDSPAPGVNKWQAASKDVEFIASKSGIATATVSSKYYSCGASVPNTIAALLKDTMKPGKPATSSDPYMQQEAFRLGQDFPTIAKEYLAALIVLTHPSTANAHELAKALTTKSHGSSYGGALIPTYAPLQIFDNGGPSGTGRSSRTSSASPTRPLDLATASSLAGTYNAARLAAAAQAQAAYRKSKSDRLMGGAAGYYSQVSRDHAAAASAHTSAAADALVTMQSKPGEIDLHGVNVQDAVRIARNSVESWWSNMGESRVNGRLGASDRARGFSIVTGVGKHSEGGRSKINPAITRMLKDEGWRIEGGSGVIYVKGRSKV